MNLGAMIYLDNNATTPIHAEVVEAMNACWRSGPLNPASQHQSGRRAERLLEESRETVARLVGARLTGSAPDRVIFTSGGTEANNQAIFGLNPRGAGKVVVSAIEHPSVAAAADRLEARGLPVERLRVDSSGVADEAHLRSLLEQSPTRLVSVMLVNNEIGVIQPVPRLAELCRGAGVAFHTDAVQAIGKIPTSFQDLGVTAMTMAPHKFHGPVGIGALILRGDAEIEPMLVGGAQQLGRRAGTEPVALAVGMARALEIWSDTRLERYAQMLSLRDLLERRILEGWPQAIIVGAEAPRAPHTANIAFPGIDRQAGLIALDLAGVACSTGSACASGSSEPSPALLAMGRPDPVVRSSLRFSVSVMNTQEEIEEASRRILRVVASLRKT
jgi:cysteine desulfurase